MEDTFKFCHTTLRYGTTVSTQYNERSVSADLLPNILEAFRQFLVESGFDGLSEISANYGGMHFTTAASDEDI